MERRCDMERLIVYETDKGNYAVRPEQWAGIIDKNGRIKECGLNHTAIFHYKKDAEWYADAKNAEEQGLLLRLPVAEGSTVFTLGYIYECMHDYKCELKYDQYKCEENVPCERECKRWRVKEAVFNNKMLNAIGKTVFLTKQEAEQALARMEKE